MQLTADTQCKPRANSPQSDGTLQNQPQKCESPTPPLGVGHLTLGRLSAQNGESPRCPPPSPVPATPYGQPSATRSASSVCSGDYRPRSPRARPTASNGFAMVCGQLVACSASPPSTAKYSGPSVKASSTGSRRPASPAGLAGRQEAGWRSAGPWMPPSPRRASSHFRMGQARHSGVMHPGVHRHGNVASCGAVLAVARHPGRKPRPLRARSSGLPVPREPAFVSSASQDGEAEETPSERRAGCP
jgi:hypothetical protein